ncbi:MAG: helicase HerA-like domain-containing protein [Candidatus Aenigmatarchaeota archaeon]
MGKILCYLLLVLFLLLFLEASYSFEQHNYLFDLTNAKFNFSIYNLNDSSTAKEIVFNANEAKTVWINIPKNSSIINSIIEIEGLSRPLQTTTQQQVMDLATDNIIFENDWDEIVIGSAGSSQNLKLLNSNGIQLWNFSISADVTSVATGNLSLDNGKEILAASNEPKIYLINSSGSLKNSKIMSNTIYDIEISEILSFNPFDEIAIASNDNKLYLLSYNLSEIWTFTASSPFKGVGVGELSSQEGKEIAASSGSMLYILNSSGYQINAKNLEFLINDVDVANFDNSGYDEIAAVTNNGTLYLLDNNLNILWSYSIQDVITKVKIAEVTSEYDGKEIVFGSYDDYVYIINKNGNLIWKYKAENDVKGIDVGNLTIDPGNEVVVGTQIPATNTLYVLNFEYFPTNPYLDIGNDSDYEWQYTGKFRSKINIAPNSEIQEFLNNCEPDKQGYCVLPLVFYSDFPGILKISFINISYSYDVSNIFQINTVAAWSRTNNVKANESIGNQIKNISYLINPSHDISFKYITIDSSATLCDFNGTRHSIAIVDGKKVCNISLMQRTIPSSSNMSYDWLWDNTMSSTIPVYYNESQGISENGFWKKNVTVWNVTHQIFTNVTLNSTLDENYITGNSRIKVDWFGNNTFYDITPAFSQNNCNTTPTYTAIKLENDTFYVCKQDTNNDGRIDLFVWKQPHTNKNYTIYEISGSANNPPFINNISFTPSEDHWGKNFTISMNVTDIEGNNISVKVCLNLTHTFNLTQINLSSITWSCVDEKNTTGDTTKGEEIKFELESNKTWTGYNLLYIELKDFDENVEYHDWFPGNMYFWPNVTKHIVEPIIVEGEGAEVNRTSSVNITVLVNDTIENKNVTGANCIFWVSMNNTKWSEGKNIASNSSGYCTYIFEPNSSYVPGLRWWKVAINDSYYESDVSENYTIHIYGKINLNITQDTLQNNITRNIINKLKGKMFDEYNNTINQPGYQCSFRINQTNIGSNTTDSSGICYIDFVPDCSYILGKYNLNITLSGNADPYYIFDKNNDEKEIYLKDMLNTTILSPQIDEIYHKGENMNLNFSVKDSCDIPTEPYISIWSLNCTTNGYPPFYDTKNEQNTTWNVQCNPGILVLTLETYGELYQETRTTKNIDIYGWSEIKMISPTNGTYNRTETDRKIDIVCEVYDSNTSSIKLDGYNVDILYMYEGSPAVKLTTMNTLYPFGKVNYTWDISSNETVPEGLYKIICNISDQVLDPYRKYNASNKESYSDIIIIEKDTTPPRINSIKVNSTILGGNTTLTANISDWYGVDFVWIDLIYPNKTTETFYLVNTTSDKRQTIWEINFTDMNNLGDYDITLFANDTSNYTSINQTWFEVYLPIQLYAYTNYPKKYTLYRPGTDLLIHNFSYGEGWHNLTLHQRTYDFKAEITDNLGQSHEIIFKDLNTTLTSEKQFGQISNITNPLNISTVPLFLLNPTVPWRHELAGIYISTNFAYSNLTISFDYSKKLDEIDYAPAIVIYKCSNWTGKCNSGWVQLNTTVNTSAYKVFTIQNSTSAYYAFEAEICGNGICGIGESCINCVADCGECVSGTIGTAPLSSGGGGEGGGSSYRAVCGNSICDPDENPFTCPQDCSNIFSVKTNLTQDYVLVDSRKTYAVWISNLMSQPLQASILITGPASNLLFVKKTQLIIDSTKEIEVPIELIVPKDVEPGSYTGQIIVSGGNIKERLPITIFVTKETSSIQINVKTITKSLKPNETLAFEISIFSLTQRKEINGLLQYSIQKVRGQEIYTEKETGLIKLPYQSIKYVHLPENISAGKYYVVANLTYEDQYLSDLDSFEISIPIITAKTLRYVLIVLGSILALTVSIIIVRRYLEWKKSKYRYIFPVDFSLLPKGELSIGKVAETNIKATFSSSDLTTHILVAGATGAGKSVTASIFAEELLEKKIPVVVFDPTAQWTGFVKPCKDENVLKYYKKHGMTIDNTKSYPGNIYEMTDPKTKIDFKKYMNPGEITVFVLNKLKPGEYDEAVTNIIDSIFAQSWEESTQPKLIIVFDEVHRLLEKYGGKGGYVALERACREFRKWGIGLIMASQVLSDFKEAIKGNVLTEIQMHTKSLNDLQRIEKKYGLEYARRVAKEEVGIGMIQNPKYNKGLPWFVSFRPPMHMPHKITDQEMQMYKEYNSRIEKLEQEIEKLEKAGKDVFDLKIELKLAKDKLKKGMFRVAEIYIESLNKKLGLSK